MGIRSEYLFRAILGMERIFHPFEQLDRTRSHHHDGTGLGLALVSQLVELHRGQRVD